MGGRGGGSGGGGGGSLTEDEKAGFSTVADAVNSGQDGIKLQSKDVSKVDSFLNGVDKFYKSAKDNNRATEFVTKTHKAALDSKLKTKFDTDSKIISNNDGLIVKVGKGSFNVKDNLKDNGYKFSPVDKTWNKSFTNLKDIQSDFKKIGV